MSELRTEAGLLLQTVEDRLLEWRSLVPTPVATPSDAPAPNPLTDPAPTDVAPDHADHVGHQGDADSRGAAGNGCPLCTLLAVLRGERPELAAALLDGALTALHLARSLLAQQAGPDGTAAAPNGAATAPDGAVPDGAATDGAATDGAATANGAATAPDGPAADPPAARGSVPPPAPALPAAVQRRPPERIRIS